MKQAIKPIREPASIAEAMFALTTMQIAIKQAVPGAQETKVEVSEDGQCQCIILLHSLADPSPAVFALAHLVQGYSFEAVTQGREGGMRGRHRIVAKIKGEAR